MAIRPSQSINLGLAAIPDVESPELYSALLPIYSAIRNVMYALDGYTGNNLVTPEEYSQVNAFQQMATQKTAVVYVKLTEDVSAGHMIHLFDSSGLAAKKAVYNTLRCHGYAVASGLTGEYIPVCLMGACTLVGGLTIGAEYYLSSVAGQITTTVTGQHLGTALSSNLFWFTP